MHRLCGVGDVTVIDERGLRGLRGASRDAAKKLRPCTLLEPHILVSFFHHHDSRVLG